MRASTGKYGDYGMQYFNGAVKSRPWTGGECINITLASLPEAGTGEAIPPAGICAGAAGGGPTTTMPDPGCALRESLLTTVSAENPSRRGYYSSASYKHSTVLFINIHWK